MNDVQRQTMNYDVARGYYYDGIKNVKSDLENIKNNFILLGYHLKEICDNKWYRFKYTADEFDRFCKEEFNFSKSTVYRLIQIQNKFCAPDAPELLPQYESFSKSQLEEMASMSDEDIAYIKPDMTIKEIRQYKTYEIKTPSHSDQVPGQMKMDDDSEIVEGEYKEVATSQLLEYVEYDSIKRALAKMISNIQSSDVGELYKAGYVKAYSDITRTMNLLKRTKEFK